MPEQTISAIHIDRLNLHIPDRNTGTDHHVANGLGQCLPETNVHRIRGHLGAMNIRIHVPTNASEPEMSHAIADAMVNVWPKRSQTLSAKD